MLEKNGKNSHRNSYQRKSISSSNVRRCNIIYSPKQITRFDNEIKWCFVNWKARSTVSPLINHPI